jgi:hypothetical protein
VCEYGHEWVSRGGCVKGAYIQVCLCFCKCVCVCVSVSEYRNQLLMPQRTVQEGYKGAFLSFIFIVP